MQRADAPERAGNRERNRLRRHRTYLQAALHLTFEEGLAALTMQRLAHEVGAAVGTVYTYFPSKGALVAEVQREAIERLSTSATLLGADVDRAVSSTRPAPSQAVADLAPIVAFGRFWLTAGATYPEEMQLLLLLLSDVSEAVPAEEGGRVVPAAMRLLGLADDRLAVAADRGTLRDDIEPDRRTIGLAAALTGCVQLECVRRWDEELLDPQRNGRIVLDSLLLGWGADADALAAAHRLVDHLESTGPLARPVPEGPDL